MSAPEAAGTRRAPSYRIASVERTADRRAVMVNPARVDAIVDLAYGALIVLAIVLIATLEFGLGIAFGLGVFSAYVLHVVWKMARFDPDWMTAVVEEAVEGTVEEAVEGTVEDAVDETVERKVDEAVEETVEETVEQSVEATVGERIDTVRERVDAVDERVERRPREERIEELIEDSIADDGEPDADGRE